MSRVSRLVVLIVFSMCAVGYAQYVEQNVNMVAGTKLIDGDPFLQRQNEPSVAVSTRNSLNLLALGNDYRSVDIPFDTGAPADFEERGDAWLGVFKSRNGGASWWSTLLEGYPQQTNSTSPLHGYQAGADPVVRSGPHGMFYASGIVLNRGTNPLSGVFVARWIDNNNTENGDPFGYLGATMIDRGTSGAFIDKPWVAVGPGSGTCSVTETLAGNTVTQSFPAQNVYVAYTIFVGNDNNIRSKLMFVRSTDCGVTWSTPIKLSEGYPVNQGASIVVSPTGPIFVVWRQFKTTNVPDAILIAKSTDNGQTFTKGSVVRVINQFEQGMTTAEIRTNAYPAAAADANGRVYIAWADRLTTFNSYGDGRIVLIHSADGLTNWSDPPKVVDPGQTRGHQFMPTMTIVGGKIVIGYYDLRDDSTIGVFSNPLKNGVYNETRQDVGDRPSHPEFVWTPALQDQSGHRRHTLDLQAARATLSAMGPGSFDSLVRVSRYRFGIRQASSLSACGFGCVEQLQFNVPNLPLFRKGTAPFIGDYIDVTGYASGNAPVYHFVWTDNRDVRPPQNGDWTNYTPPNSAAKQTTSFFNGTQTIPCTPGMGQTGMRNQNLYSARVTDGLFAAVAGSSKTLGVIQRTFAVYVQNSKAAATTFRLTIRQQPAPCATTCTPAPQASFDQFALATQIDVPVPAHSSATRTAYITATDPHFSTPVDVVEIDGIGGSPLPTGLSTTVVTNPDPTNPDPTNPDPTNPDPTNPDPTNPDPTNGSIVNNEVHTVNLSNPDPTNPDPTNTAVTNPDPTNPDPTNPDPTNPDPTNADLANSAPSADVTNATVPNTDIQNPDPTNASVTTDTTWTIQNKGNTSSGYEIKLVTNTPLPANVHRQLIIYQRRQTPTASTDSGYAGCSLILQTTSQLITNSIDPAFTDPGDVLKSNPNNATLSLAPGDGARITFRLFLPSGVTFDPATAVATVAVSQANNNINGVIAPAPSVGSSLPFMTALLTDAVTGRPYTGTFVFSGGKPPYTWSLPANATGSIATDAFGNGIYKNTFFTSDGPQQITVTVTDAANFTMTKTFSVAVYDPLLITTTAIPPATLNQSYSATLSSTGGKSPFTYSQSNLPPGLSLNTATGEISGTPTAPFTGEVVFRISDSANPKQQSSTSLYLSVASPAGGCSNTVTKLRDTSNTSKVFNGGTSPSFTTPEGQTYCLDSIWTYHWNDGAGKLPVGTIGLTTNCANSCTVLGPWQAVGSAGQNNAPNVNWTATPPSGSPVLLNGTYNVVDSDPASWSYNNFAPSNGQGFTIVYGRLYTPPLHAALIHLTYNGQPLTPGVAPQMFAKNLDTGNFLNNSQIVWNGNDTVTVSGLPDAHYVIEVAIPRDANTGRYFPGGFWQQVSFLISGADTNVTMPESRLIHLTLPADNANFLGTSGPGCQPPSLTVPRPASITWETADPNVTNVTYRYSLVLVDCSNNSRTPVTSGSTQSLSVDLTPFAMAPTTSTQFYQLTLHADSAAENDVAQIMAVGDNYNFYGWALNFTIPDSGRALAFDGINDLVTVPHSASLSLQGGTIEGWIKIDDGSAVHLPLLSKGADFGNYTLEVLGSAATPPAPHNVSYVHQVANGNFSCCNVSPGPVPFGVWTHIAATYSDGAARVYVNGQFVATAGGGGFPVTNSAPLTLAKIAFSSTAAFLKGQIDEVRIWNIVRSDADIAQSFNHHVDPATPGLVAYWKFDEADGTTVSDATSNANNGSLGAAPSDGTDQPQRVASGAPIRP